MSGFNFEPAEVAVHGSDGVEWYSVNYTSICINIHIEVFFYNLLSEEGGDAVGTYRPTG